MSLYDTLEPDDIEYVYAVLDEIVNQEEILKTSADEDLSDYISIEAFYMVLFGTSADNLDRDFITYVSRVLKEIERIYRETYNEIKNFMFSDYYRERMKSLTLEMFESGEMSFPTDLIEQLGSFSHQLGSKLQHLYEEVCSQVRSEFPELIEKPEYARICSKKVFDVMASIVELYLYFEAYNTIKYDKEIFPWF